MRNQFDFRIQRQQRRNTIRSRGRIAKVSRDGAAVLDLDTADFPRRGLQSVKASRQWSLDNFGPGGKPADPDALRIANYAFQFSQTRNVDNGPASRPIPEGREKVGTARQDFTPGSGQSVYSFGERVGPEIQGMPLGLKFRAGKQFLYKRRGLYSAGRRFQSTIIVQTGDVAMTNEIRGGPSIHPQ
jgi:hypothetical protein